MIYCDTWSKMHMKNNNKVKKSLLIRISIIKTHYAVREIKVLNMKYEIVNKSIYFSIIRN